MKFVPQSPPTSAPYPKVTLEQWRALQAVVDTGGYTQAAEALHKSQSAVTYAVQKLEALLNVKVFEVLGRKARLTPTGEVLYRRARSLLDDAGALENAAGALAAGWEPELRLAVEIIFPTWLLLECLGAFAAERPEMRIELYETVLGGTNEALLQRRVDLAIGSQVPPGFTGDPLVRLRIIPVAHPQHPLHRLGRPLTLQDLRKHRHLLIRDSGSQRDSSSWLRAEQRWTFSHKASSIRAAAMGLGFTWLPQETVQAELESGLLKQLPLREGGERWAELYLVYADRDYAGPGVLRLAEVLRERVQRQCRVVAQEEAAHAAAEPAPAGKSPRRPRRAA